PIAHLTAAAARALIDAGFDVFDTTARRADGEIDDDASHPLALADAVVSAVQVHREAIEHRLADLWIAQEQRSLYVDGGISGSARAAAAPNAVGVVKSHRTLYGEAPAVRTILALAAGERSSV